MRRRKAGIIGAALVLSVLGVLAAFEGMRWIIVARSPSLDEVQDVAVIAGTVVGSLALVGLWLGRRSRND